ncbi:sulfurtransferase [Szabonella alba]|uniref:Sulfurtransferase n=1 Tax=Szabonella alba TaxID=2804194 RepID=A0A8K0Y0L2_9RHOB|nr:rhodanese-like domain-containing protein [Szabonella alba]MBL4917238.1 sulfurtransferase [Szabonella alba]
MKTYLAIAATSLLLAAPALAQQIGPLVTPQELNEYIETVEPLVLDIRTDTTPEGSLIYEAGHVPTAIPAPYGIFRGPASNPGGLPDLEVLGETLRNIGVEREYPVVIVHQGKDETDFGAAARVYWTLKSLGVSEIAILNGGMRAWEAAGLPVTVDTYSALRSDDDFTFAPDWLATTDEVRAIVEGDEQATLVDARSESFWRGEEAHGDAARPGTLPQSEYFTHSRWFSKDPTLIDAEGARALAEANGYAPGDTLVSFCNTGHWAATNWFALSELAGIEGVKLYPDSLVAWSNADLPMENVPGPMQRIWYSIKGIF